MLSSSVTEEYDHAGQVNATLTPLKRLPWNKGKLTGAKPPLRHPARRKARRPAGAGTDQLCHRRELEHRKVAWLDRAARPARSRGRGDRIDPSLPRRVMSPVGTNAKCQLHRALSEFEDIPEDICPR